MTRTAASLLFWTQLGLTLAGAVLFWLAERTFTNWQSLGSRARASRRGPDSTPASVSVVVPARNEAANLAVLLPTIPRREVVDVIVVDDDSSDATAEVAARHGARVIPAGQLPRGWTGKSHACAVGAAAARGEWLLFLDADTTLSASAIAETTRFAVASGAEAVTCLLAQDVHTFWEKLILPLAYHQLFAGLAIGPRATVLNGQFVLVRRDVYQSTGGHAASAVRGAIVEDLALGRLFRANGVRLVALRGEAIGRVRMYDSFGAIRAGFGKNAAAIVGSDWRRGALIAVASIGSVAIWPLAGIGVARGRGGRLLAYVAWLLHLWAAARWNRSFLSMAPADAVRWALLRPVAALAFQVITAESLARTYLTGQLRWKGRDYGREAARWKV